MATVVLIIALVELAALVFGISIGRGMLVYKMRQEENKKRELELALMEKRADIIRQGKKIAHDLEEVLYKTQVQQEIDDIIRKKPNR
ncbi:MAG: hypothetical protein PHC61_14200 [Chitinivibrionales bacterium]|nr:hypothetical protein [Chitinivibrionales bacterium]